MARKSYYLYGDDEEEDEDEPVCFGKRWENDDDECLDCDFSTDCRRKFLDRRKIKEGRVKVAKRRRRSIEDEALDEAATYDELMERMPRKGEHWAERVAKNSAAGMLSALGREVMLFFKKWRW